MSISIPVYLDSEYYLIELIVNNNIVLLELEAIIESVVVTIFII